jgi:hypothetical protein
MLWRFLSFDDKELSVVFCSDIDVTLNQHVTRTLQLFLNSNKTMGRLLSNPYNNNYINGDSNNPMNYTVCLGSTIAFRPRQLDINIKNTIINYILYRKNRMNANKPWEEFDDKNTERFNKPIGSHTCGWGGIWTMYGFDEKIFKHAIFPYLVQRGEILSWAYNYHNTYLTTASHDDPYLIDCNFTQSYNNEICYL